MVSVTQQEVEKIINDYENGMTFKELCEKYHHKFETIRKCLVDNNIHIRDKSEAGSRAKKYEVSEEIQNKIITNYLNGMGLIASGKEFGVGYYKVRKILAENNIHIRDKHEGIQVRNIAERKYHFNENYFKNMNSNVAYIVGFLAADGTIASNSNCVKLTLAQKDAELLEKIKKELEFDGPVKYTTTSKGFDIATLEINSAVYKEDLKKYNVVPQKTFTFSIPETIPEEYLIDFIRGYWDGDGTICTAGKSAIRSSLCSARKETLEQILTFLEKRYGIPRVSIQEQMRSNVLYYIQYSNNSTRKLFKAFYYKDNILYLERKYKKFCELCIDNKAQEAVHPECQDEKVR